MQTLEHPDRIRHLENFHLANFRITRQNHALSEALTGFFGLACNIFQEEEGKKKKGKGNRGKREN